MRTLAAGEVRGLARGAARRGVPAGRAYRLACRDYPIPSGSWSELVAAYDDELSTIPDRSAASCAGFVEANVDPATWCDV